MQFGASASGIQAGGALRLGVLDEDLRREYRVLKLNNTYRVLYLKNYKGKKL